MITDVNVSLSRWPFRRLPCDSPDKLVRRLEASGVSQAWVGSFDGLLHKDVSGVNERLVKDCRNSRTVSLRPFGTVNPTLPDWREDLHRCSQFAMTGIRIHPGYHGYALDDPVFAELLALAERNALVVQLVLRVEDPRTQHPQMRVADVDVRPLAELLAAHPKLRIVLLGALQTLRGQALAKIIQAGRVHCEISTLEGIGGVSQLLKLIPLERVLFGSHFPFFVLESALLKLRESELSAAQIAAITHGNAERLGRREA
jgi:predicted TIM-barrel fold metal-dependent hydrolase